MIKPLSYLKYFKGNKKIVVRYIATITMTAIVLAVIQIIIGNLVEELRGYYDVQDYYLEITTNNNDNLTEEEVEALEKLEDVKKVIPVKCLFLNYKGFVASPAATFCFMPKEDIKDYLNIFNIDYDPNVIDKLEENQVLTSERIQTNFGLSEGDRINTDSFAPNMDIKFKDSFETDYLIGVTPMEFGRLNNRYYLIPKDGKVKEVEKEVSDLLGTRVKQRHDREIINRSLENTMGTFSSVQLIITITCAIATGVTTYLHYYNRRKEIGILKAIGYSDKKILFRISKEIIISSAIALVISILLINLFVLGMNKFLAVPRGYFLFQFDISMLSSMTIIVLAIMIFSLVPTWILLKSVDKISLIEGR